MHVCGQTLVLVDNDLSVSEVNQKLVKATLKYIFYHMPDDRTFCLSTYEHDIETEEAFTDSVNDLVCAADNLEYTSKDSNLIDTLSEVVTRWKDSDFACRDILVFTDGLEGPATGHEKEELYYLLENSEYPVYVVFLNQDNNAEAKKSLSAVTVTSGGRLFESEFNGSDGAVDRQITEKIFGAMDAYSQVHWRKYEEEGTMEAGSGESEQPEDTATDPVLPENTAPEEETDTSEETVESVDVENEEYMGTTYDSGKVIYEYDRSPGFFGSSGALILSAALIVGGLLAGILGGFAIMKKRRGACVRISAPSPAPADDFFDDYELKGMGTCELDSDCDSETTFLSDSDYAGDGKTRLLDEKSLLVTLSDRQDEGRSYRIALAAPMTIGRGNCDVCITGDDALSKRHCELFEKSGEVYVRDLQSANGTRVNSVKVSEEKLSDGDELTIGSRSYKVVIA